MKKIKKIFAILLALTMVLGMGAVVSAEPKDNPTNPTITVTNLMKGTTVDFYKLITWKDDGKWEPENWAVKAGIITLNEEKKAWDVDKTKLANANLSDATKINEQPITVGDNKKAELQVPPGAYLIVANGVASEISYSHMIANTFDKENANVYYSPIVVAKGEKYSIKKGIVTKSGDEYRDDTSSATVGIGEEILFKVTTYIPYYGEDEMLNREYTIKDTSTGLRIDGIEKIILEGSTGTITPQSAVFKDGVYMIELANILGTGNEHAGKKLEIIYKATVTGDGSDGKAFSNKVEIFKQGGKKIVPPGPGPNPEPEVDGYTGSITVTKIEAENDEAILKGAEFTVTKVKDGDGKDISPATVLTFVEKTAGEYKVALDTDTKKTTTVVATNGTVTIKGLGAGTYHFEETKAPEGYALAANTNGTLLADQKIEKTAIENITLPASGTLPYPNSKLSSLPSTGGIGTTIFTIGGCALMIIAAGLYFATRRKNAK